MHTFSLQFQHKLLIIYLNKYDLQSGTGCNIEHKWADYFSIKMEIAPIYQSYGWLPSSWKLHGIVMGIVIFYITILDIAFGIIAVTSFKLFAYTSLL